MLPNGGVESALDGLSRLRDGNQSIGVHKVDKEIEYRSGDRIAVYIREEGEKR